LQAPEKHQVSNAKTSKPVFSPSHTTAVAIWGLGLRGFVCLVPVRNGIANKLGIPLHNNWALPDINSLVNPVNCQRMLVTNMNYCSLAQIDLEVPISGSLAVIFILLLVRGIIRDLRNRRQRRQTRDQGAEKGRY